MKKLKILTAICMILGFIPGVNAQATLKGNIVSSYDEFISRMSEQNKVKSAPVSGTIPGNLKNVFPQSKGPYKSIEQTENEEIKGNDTPRERGFIAPYVIVNRRYVSHFSFQRISQGNEVRIKIMLNSVENKNIEDFYLAYDSGNEYHMGNIYGIENVTFPLYVKVTYRSWNAFHAVQSDVTFEFTINCPGTWNVIISN